MNLATIIEEHEPSRVALIDGEVSVTYGELRAQAAAVRKVLTDHGVGPDDRVAVPSGNEPMFIAAALGALGVGARVIPMKPTNPIPELDRKLASIRPTVMLVCEEAAWTFDHAATIEAPLIDMRTIDLDTTAPPIVDRAADDIAFMMLTSGVSGNAKVAMLTHGNLEWAQLAVTENAEGGLVADDVTLGCLPFAHIFGLNTILLTSLRVGATLVVQRRFDVDDSLRLVKEHGVTVLAGAPPMWRRWSLIDADQDTFDSVRLAISGAAALPIDVFNDMFERHRLVVEEGYGLTETSPVLTTSRGFAVRAGSVGKVIDGVEMLLVEQDGTPVEIGDAGEIVVRGPGIFAGYFDDAEASGQVLTADGWFWTGDVGVFDDDGYLFLVDRVKDIIIVSGFNVYPAEVENVLIEHANVRGAVVVGGANLETGETVIAHVIADVDAAELDAFARARLSRYKCPTEFHLVDELPVAPTGKLIRRELR
ncbi:MAG: long-chain acyl-CoA synthetase [Verrucomicrobiales bacterium]